MRPNLEAGSKRVTSFEAVLKTTPRVPRAREAVSPAPSTAVVAPVSSRSVPHPASSAAIMAPPVRRSMPRRVTDRRSSGAAPARSPARSDEPPDRTRGPQVGSSSHLVGLLGIAPALSIFTLGSFFRTSRSLPSPPEGRRTPRTRLREASEAFGGLRNTVRVPAVDYATTLERMSNRCCSATRLVSSAGVSCEGAPKV